MHQLLLTFDVEDFINPNEIWSLNTFLELLKKYELSAIFFVAGHMSEILVNFPKTLELLKTHEIGFHSSGHSVRPIIAEYTDLQSYQQAFLNSLKRETAHIESFDRRNKRRRWNIFSSGYFWFKANKSISVTWHELDAPSLRSFG